MHLTKLPESAQMDLEVRLESIHFLHDSRLKTCTKVYTLLYYWKVWWCYEKLSHESTVEPSTPYCSDPAIY
jgi:hypothetical protein